MYVNEASDNYGMCFCAGFVGYENPNSVLVIDRCANHGDITMNCDTCYFSCADLILFRHSVTSVFFVMSSSKRLMYSYGNL